MYKEIIKKLIEDIIPHNYHAVTLSCDDYPNIKVLDSVGINIVIAEKEVSDNGKKVWNAKIPRGYGYGFVFAICCVSEDNTLDCVYWIPAKDIKSADISIEVGSKKYARYFNNTYALPNMYEQCKALWEESRVYDDDYNFFED